MLSQGIYSRKEMKVIPCICRYSMGSSSHKYSEKGYFHNLGIDNIDGSAARGQWVVKRLQSIIKILGHEKVNCLFLSTLDIEYTKVVYFFC